MKVLNRLIVAIAAAVSLEAGTLSATAGGAAPGLPRTLLETTVPLPPAVLPSPVVGPLATTMTAVPGAATGGIAPDLYQGTGRNTVSRDPLDIAQSTPTDPATVIAQPRRRQPPATAGSGGSSRLDDTKPGGGGNSLADCMAFWDKATHMTRTEWRRACRRTMSGTSLGSAKPR